MCHPEIAAYINGLSDITLFSTDSSILSDSQCMGMPILNISVSKEDLTQENQSVLDIGQDQCQHLVQ